MEDLFDFVNKMQKFSSFANQLNSASDFARSIAMDHNSLNSVKNLTGMAAINKIVSFQNQFTPKIYKNHSADAFTMLRDNTLALNQNKLVESMVRISQLQNNIVSGFSDIAQICSANKNILGVNGLMIELTRSLDALKVAAYDTEEIEEIEKVAEVYQAINEKIPSTLEYKFVIKTNLQKFKLDFMGFLKTQIIQKREQPRTLDEWLTLVAAICVILDYLCD